MKNFSTYCFSILVLLLLQSKGTKGAEALPARDTLPIAAWAAPPSQEAWSALLNQGFRAHEQHWQLNAATLYAVSVVNKSGKPVANASVCLEDDTGKVIGQGWSDQNGVARLWVPTTAVPKRLIARLSGHEVSTELEAPEAGGIPLKVALEVPCQELRGVDLRFFLDATQSMHDEFPAILPMLQSMSGPVLLGRDLGERFLVQLVDTTAAPAFTFQAAGGGPDEEAVDTLLLAALQHADWDMAAPARVLVYVTDAHPGHHPGAAVRMQKAIQLAAQKGVAIWPVGCSGLNEEGEYLLQSMAVLTGGQYAWLEDTPGNSEVHRRPILTGDAVSSEFTAWLPAQIEKINDFYSCTSDQLEAPVVAHAASAVFGCFPNPARTQASLKVPVFAERIALYNSAGQPVRNWKRVEVGEMTFSVAQLPAGSYRLEANAGKERWVASLVVVR